MYKMACISAEKGTKIFAYFNIVTSVLSLISAIVIPIIIIIGIFINASGHRSLATQLTDVFADDLLNGTMLIPGSLILVLGLIISAISVMFASFLLNGVRKKNPRHIKAYFIYGIVTMCIAILAYIGLSSLHKGYIGHTLTALLIITFGIYIPILYMIRITYMQYQVHDYVQVEFNNQKQLVQLNQI